MKIYNKKGFILGFIWFLLGGWLFIHSMINAEGNFPKQIENIIVSLILLIVGFTRFFRAFSKRATMQDLIEEQDERNKLMTLKIKAKILDFMIFILTIFMAIDLIGYIFTENIAWGFVFFITVLLLTFYWILYIIIGIYYEKND
jgi:hypothetical protein|nr:hypothetical protein [uncultured Oscillibacter sp.]